MLLMVIDGIVAAALLYQQIHEIARIVSRVAGLVAVVLMALAWALGA